MVVKNSSLPTLSDLFNINVELLSGISDKKWQIALSKAQREWMAAIASLPVLFDKDTGDGLILCSSVFWDSSFLEQFQIATFTNEAFRNLPLIPAANATNAKETSQVIELPLLPNDPITNEQFCLLFTANFGLILVLGTDINGLPVFNFSFEPEILQKAWTILRWRLLVTNHYQLSRLDYLIKDLAPPGPDYRIVTEFTRGLLKNLPPHSVEQHKKIDCLENVPKQVDLNDDKNELELLQALTHEIRTPLTTIRTLTRLVLKRSKEIGEDIRKRLESIDQECSEQINRMELIFKAAELQTKPSTGLELTPISLEQLFKESIPRWKKQAQRRDIMLDVILPEKLPKVKSDPAVLNQILTGLMEKFTRSLNSGGHLRVEVTTVGNQLKLELVSQCASPPNPFKSLGQLLALQPETGSLTLNMDVTKNIFNQIGGKMIVRQKPQQGEVLTIFLPYEVI